MSRFRQVFFIFIFLFSSLSVFAANVPLNDDVYFWLEKFEAEGLINSGLLAIKPLSRSEVARLIEEADKNSSQSPIFIKNVISKLKKTYADDLKKQSYFKPIDSISLSYIYTNETENPLVYNNNGDKYGKDSNLRFSFYSFAEYGNFSGLLNPVIKYSDDSSILNIEKAYITANFFDIDFLAGKDELWWSYGKHGSILLSNNHIPFTMFNITNQKPYMFSNFLKYLGLIRFDLFVTKLDDDNRKVPDPFFWGMKINIKPATFLELGVHRTAFLGGKGRDAGYKTWVKSFTSENENEENEAGDQRAGFDIKITAPFKLQPFQIYLEADGEDQGGFFPYKWAYVAGLYLPRILTLDRLSLNFEYANTYVSGWPSVWYRHHIYEKYYFRDDNIGHHKMPPCVKTFFHKF